MSLKISFVEQTDNELLGKNDFKFFPARAQHPDLTFTGAAWFVPVQRGLKSLDRYQGDTIDIGGRGCKAMKVS